MTRIPSNELGQPADKRARTYVTARAKAKLDRVPDAGGNGSSPKSEALASSIPVTALRSSSGAWLKPSVRTKLLAAVKIYQEWLDVADLSAFEFVLGTIAANQYDADPLWGMIVGGPGSGKSELLRSLSRIESPAIHEVSTITMPGLLSGVKRKDHDVGAQGGLLALHCASVTSGVNWDCIR